MGDSCDVGPYRAARSAQEAAAGVYTVDVARGATALMLQARGTSAAPGVELIAPNDTRYTSPHIAAKIVPGHDAFVKDPQNHSTEVMIARPVPGVWRIRALSGSSITAIERASVDEMPMIQAGVGGSGEDRVLGYSYQRQPLHTTRFVEDGANYEQELGVAAGRPCLGIRAIHPDPSLCGEIHFTPAPGPADGRRLLDVVRSGDHQVTVRDVGPQVGVRVRVAPLRSDDTQWTMRTVRAHERISGPFWVGWIV